MACLRRFSVISAQSIRRQYTHSLAALTLSSVRIGSLPARSLFGTTPRFHISLACPSLLGTASNADTSYDTAARVDVVLPTPLSPGCDQLRALIAEARVRPLRSFPSASWSWRKPNEKGEWLCRGCGEFLHTDAFHRRAASKVAVGGRICHNVDSRCKKCRQTAALTYYRTLRGNVSHLVAGARYRSKKKQFPESTLTAHDILDMLWNHQGRCAYSGVALEILRPNSHWRMSLERIDNWKGYSRENCLLVAAEFNTADFSRAQGVILNEVSGTAQWSAEKVQSVFHIRCLNVDLIQLEEDIRQARFPIRKPCVRTSQHRLSNPAGQWLCPKCGSYKFDSMPIRQTVTASVLIARIAQGKASENAVRRSEDMHWFCFTTHEISPSHVDRPLNWNLTTFCTCSWTSAVVVSTATFRYSINRCMLIGACLWSASIIRLAILRTMWLS
ncbi:unnamed protein product [Polarella glacialis]|uniref:Uncharacterized protein n=1 Tax=Polarella glacialis TaxID=89957 RepID=A0A813I862_POLGL|nr:unnamed protein product [Polarella glacialis]